jgi:hypothetical protein
LHHQIRSISLIGRQRTPQPCSFTSFTRSLLAWARMRGFLRLSVVVVEKGQVVKERSNKGQNIPEFKSKEKLCQKRLTNLVQLELERKLNK